MIGMNMKLYLGVIPGLYPWLEEPEIREKMGGLSVGVVISFWNFRKKMSKIIQKGIHDYLSWDGVIMVDSGAYSAFNIGIDINIDDYLAFLRRIDLHPKDKVVNLDSIGDTETSRKNWNYLSSHLPREVLPVIHFPDTHRYYESEELIGLGGMVPALKINQKGSVFEIAEWLKVIQTQTNSLFHGFGIGSPFHQIAFLKHLYSIDWVGWRRNAAMCSCYTPEGSVYIHEARRKKKPGKKLDDRLFDKYSPPFIDNYKLLTLEGTKGWKYRALWNVWWFLNAQQYKKIIQDSNYVKRIQRRIGAEI